MAIVVILIVTDFIMDHLLATTATKPNQHKAANHRRNEWRSAKAMWQLKEHFPPN
jgi:hypothetical protein